MPDLNTLPLEAVWRELARTGLPARVFELARDEDLGAHASSGDVTSEVSIDASARSTFVAVARKPGIVAGLLPARDARPLFAPDAMLDLLVADGELVEPGTTLARLSGPTRQILAFERTFLNLVGRLSGIATRTRQFSTAMGGGHRARLYDTRKTTPGLRVLEKYAVRCGGGVCHRMGLYDAVLLKDNHLAGVPVSDLARFVGEASRAARARWRERGHGAADFGGSGCGGFVEVEVDSLDQLEAVLSIDPAQGGGVDMVLLDNMGPETLARAVAMRNAQRPDVWLEASGGVTLETIRSIALSGVDRISVGSLTHGAASLDIGLDAAPADAGVRA